jgi:hypothetical protein
MQRRGVAQLFVKRYPSLPDPLASAHILVTSVALVSRWQAHSAPPGVERQALIASLVRMIKGLVSA